MWQLFASVATRSLHLFHPPLLRRWQPAVTLKMANRVNSISGSKELPQLDDIFKQKQILRTKVRKILKEMDPALRSQQDNAVQKIVLEAPWFKSSRRFGAYISCNALREVETSKVLSDILQNEPKDEYLQSGKKLVPRVEDKNSNMRMLKISRMDDLVTNSMNILEPAPVDANGNECEDVMHAEPVDLFLLPGLAFDRSGRRLGRGGGYYDTFLKNYQELVKARN